MLIRNVRALLRHPLDPSSLTDSAPLVVLNNFGGGSKQASLMTSMLQGMFPAIDIATVRLASCQRVVLFHFDKVRGGACLSVHRPVSSFLTVRLYRLRGCSPPGCPTTPQCIV